MQLSLKDKVALIVGATDEIGRVIALRLAGLGATVALLDTESGKLAELVAEISKAGGNAIAITANPADPQTARNCADQICSRHGGIHVLVNNTPDPQGHGLAGLTTESFIASVTNTLGGQFAFMRAVLPIMRKQGNGRVVNLSSIGYLGLPGGADTAAAQSAIFGLTRSIALEAAADQVTVNTVVKGDVTHAGLTGEEAAKRAAGVPVKRLGTPDDIAYAVGFFATDASKYVTGQTFFVCGGKSAYFSMSV